MRMSEILSIRRDNVDVSRRRIYVPKAKAGAREQPMTVELASYAAMERLETRMGTEKVVPITPKLHRGPSAV